MRVCATLFNRVNQIGDVGQLLVQLRLVDRDGPPGKLLLARRQSIDGNSHGTGHYRSGVRIIDLLLKHQFEATLCGGRRAAVRMRAKQLRLALPNSEYLIKNLINHMLKCAGGTVVHLSQAIANVAINQRQSHAVLL